MPWPTTSSRGPALAARLAHAVAVAAALGLGAPADTSAVEGDPDTGVSATLAQSRHRAFHELTYELAFRVPESKTAPVTGTLRLSLTARGPLESLVLDFAAAPAQVHAVDWDGAPAAHDVANEHLVVRPPGGVTPGAHAVTVEFTSGDAALNRSEDFLYTLFVPARARLAFPCFDQPDLKARFTLALDVPAGWEAVANGAETARSTGEGRTTLRFAQTLPLPTYLFAFATGKVSVEIAERDGRTYRMFHRETDAKKLARNRDAVFDLHAASLAWLEQYTGIPYPWGKFDFFLVPAFQFGGMEHAGAIFYNAPVLLLDETATTNQVLGRASLIAHETAHMWFGDLVTMRWFDDVWMKEVFANFMAAKIVNPSFPQLNHELRFFLGHYPAAYDVDRTAGTHPVRQPLDNLANAGTLYGAIIYQKAPIAMRQLERLLGEDPMREGLREYLRTFSFANASWPDLIRLLDARTPDDLEAWSRVWIKDAGRPTFRASVSDGDGVRTLAVSQSDPFGGGRVWPQLLDVQIGWAGRVDTVPVRVRETETRVTLPRDVGAARSSRTPGSIDFVLASGGGLGYGRFELDAASRVWLLAHVHELDDALVRGSAWVTLWDDLLEAGTTPAAFADATLRGLPGERDVLNLQRMLGYLEAVFWRFHAPSARAALAPRMEETLRTGLASAPAGPVKAAWFQSYLRLGTTPSAVQWFERLWRGQERVEGLALAEADFITLSQELALRGVAGANGILEEQAGRIENPDRKARFAFVRPALSADAAVRAAFFDSLKDLANRRREAWVLEALGFLHHPLRAPEAERFVLPSLEMLDAIQRTGDIFFPKRWVDSTLSGHQSGRVAAAVRAFLGARPDYPTRLRRIVLQSADDLLRAARILETKPDGARSL